MKKYAKKAGDIILPGALGVAGFTVAKVVNKIPTGKDDKGEKTTLANNPFMSGIAKMVVGAMLPSIARSISPKLTKHAVPVGTGVFIAGGHDILMKVLPDDVKDWLGSPDFFIAGTPNFNLGDNPGSIRQG
jgi:hypothetical protein